MEVVPSITAAPAGAAAIQQSLTMRGVSRSVAFVTLSQGTENLASHTDQKQPIQNPQADTLVYYAGRKDAANAAKQPIGNFPNHTTETPVHILESVDTQNKRHWSSTLGELTNGKANDWLDSASPPLIIVGEALREKQEMNQSADLQNSGAKCDNDLQDSLVITDGRRSA